MQTLTKQADPAQNSYQYLEDLATAHWYSEVLFAALDLDLFTLIHRNGGRIDEWAPESGWDGDALARLCEALGAVGLLVGSPHDWENGPLAAKHLVEGAPEYLGRFLKYRNYFAPHWKRLAGRVRVGVEVNQRNASESSEAYRRRVFEYVEALDAQARLKAEEAVDVLDWWTDRSPKRVLDFGGGAGAWARSMVRRWPDCRAVLADLPEVIEAGSRRYPLSEDWQGVARLACDVRKPPLREACFDLVLLSNVLHAYGTEEAGALVQTAASLLNSDGILVVHDYDYEGLGADPLKGKLYDLHMLLNTYNGRIHEREAVEDMLRRAGLNPWLPHSLDTDTMLLAAGRGPSPRPEQGRKGLWAFRARKMGFRKATPMHADRVVTAPWVRLKCAYGCSGFGRNLQCPPHSPDEREMNKVLAAYDWGLLVQGEPPGREFHQRLLKLEREIFLAGHPKALAFGAGPCTLCKTCDPSGACSRPDQARPALEACGVDVYGTAAAAGWSLAPVADAHGFVHYLGLILVELEFRAMRGSQVCIEEHSSPRRVEYR